jgi:transcriptional regulator with XRE-family HTH domain
LKPHSTVGQKLRAIREEKGLSLRSVARAAKVDPSYLSKLERGLTTALRPERLDALADALQVDLSSLGTHVDQGTGVVPDSGGLADRTPKVDVNLPHAPNRAEILNWLRPKSVELADMYDGAASLVARGDFPGRLRFVSHAVRETANRLPDVIVGPTQSLNYTDRVEKIASRWGKASKLRREPRAEDTGPTAEEVPIGRDLYLMVDELVRDHQGGDRRRAKAERMFEALLSGSAGSILPVIQQWMEVTGWFQARAHLPSREVEADGPPLEEMFRLFDTALGALVRGFFDIVRDLDDILERANR